MSIKKTIFKIFNGTSWDDYYHKTSSDQVVHTKADGTATTVQEELLEQNSALVKVQVFTKTVNITSINGYINFADELDEIPNKIAVIPHATTHSKNSLVLGYCSMQQDKPTIVRYAFPAYNSGITAGTADISVTVIYR